MAPLHPARPSERDDRRIHIIRVEPTWHMFYGAMLNSRGRRLRHIQIGATDPTASTRRNVRVGTTKRSRSARSAARWARSTPAYVVVASSTCRSRSSSRVGWTGDGPPLPWTRPPAPSARASQQPPDRADREAQVGRRFARCDLTRQDVIGDIQALLCSAVQSDRLPRFHGIKSDKVAVPLARTESLSLDIITTTS